MFAKLLPYIENLEPYVTKIKAAFDTIPDIYKVNAVCFLTGFALGVLF